jgi:hypothetical protein
MDPISKDTKQPEAQPPQPVMTQQPVGSTPAHTTTSTASGAPKDKKPFIIGGIIAAVVVVLIIIVTVILASMSVSKSDYREALNKYDDLRTANSKLTTNVSKLSYTISSGTDTTFKNNIEAVEEGLDTVKAENEELGKLKAVKTGEGAEAYEAFDKKLEEYLSYSNNLVTSIKNLRDPLLACNKATKGVSASKDRSAISAVIKSCTDKIDSVKNVPDPDMKTFVDALQTSLKELDTILDQASGITDPYGAQYEQYKVLRDKTTKVQENLRNASKDLSSNLDKRDKDTNPKKEALALSELLVEKSSR